MGERNHRVIVANPRKLRAIYKDPRKCDGKDVEMLARLARADEALLGPVKHGSEEAQRDFLQIKLRDNLVRQRVNIETFSLVCYNYREEFNLKCSDKK